MLFAALLGGCLGSQELSSIQADFEREHPEAQFETDVVLSLGPLTLDAAFQLTGLARFDRLQPIVRSVEGVKLGVYNIEGDLSEERFTPASLDHIIGRGWTVMMREQSPPQQSWLLYKTRSDRVRDFFVVQIDADQLVLVRFRGDLEHLIAAVLAERDWNLDDEALRVIP